MISEEAAHHFFIFATMRALGDPEDPMRHAVLATMEGTDLASDLNGGGFYSPHAGLPVLPKAGCWCGHCDDDE